jgi:distribution and morphology protein 10
MREFMDYVHSAFYDATGWNRDNSYAALNSTADGAHNSLRPSLGRFAGLPTLS